MDTPSINTKGYLHSNPVPTMIRLPYIIYKWTVVVPVLTLSTIFVGGTTIALSMLGAENMASRVFARAWARINCGTALMKVEVSGEENFDPATSYVIVANHQSLTDIYVLYGFLKTDIKWVLKKELRAIPVFGKAAEAMGHIIIDRSNTKAAIQSINDARERIHSGMSIIFFPEGTRSEPGNLRNFKKGAFRLAQELGLPILPIAIHGSANILPTKTIDLMPGKAILEFCEPIPTKDLETRDVARLANQARDAIHLALLSN